MNAVRPETCPLCGGSGWQVTLGGDPPRRSGRACPCRRERIREERLKQAGIPERYQHCVLGQFSAHTPTLMKAKRIAETFVDEYPAVEKEMGILFVGPAGVGKTHLAVSILAELIRAKAIQGLYCDFSELLMKIQTSFRPDAGFSKEDVLVPYVGTDLLVLDELGAAKPTAWVHDILYYLLNRRYNRQGITVVTSNYEDEAPPGERETLSDRIGYRLRSRLYEMCRLVPMRAEDYRREAVAASTNT